MTLDAASRVYHTEPQEKRDQPWFANQVVRVLCRPPVSAPSLLESLLAIEVELGRDRTAGEGAPERFGPRVIDLDLLLFGDEVLRTERLELPHPRMAERAFVLVPLVEIAPEATLPDGRTAAEALAALDYALEGDEIRQ